jgi:hypothetical protein
MTAPTPSPAAAPSTPSPTITALVFSLLRSILMLAAALGIYHGATVDDGTLMLISGGIVAVATAAWSLYDKLQAARKQHAAALASALAGRAVQPPAA